MLMLIRIGLVFCSICLTASAETYSWVDKNGKKHFGDKIPPEYASQANSVQLKTINTIETPPQKEPDKRIVRPPVDAYPDLHRDSPPEHSNRHNNATSCEKKWEAFRAAEMCFANCYSGKNRNAANCPCRNISRPSC